MNKKASGMKPHRVWNKKEIDDEFQFKKLSFEGIPKFIAEMKISLCPCKPNNPSKAEYS